MFILISLSFDDTRLLEINFVTSLQVESYLTLEDLLISTY